MILPCRVRETVGGLTRPRGHLRERLPGPKGPIHPTDVRALPSRQGDMPMPS